MFRYVIIAAAIALLGLASVSCRPPESGQVGAAARKPTTALRVAMSLAQSEWQVMRQEVLPPFERANNVTVEAVQIEAADVVRQLEAKVRANRVDIDLIAQDNNSLAPLVSKGLVEDLSDFRARIPKEVLPSMLPVLEFSGRLNFLPYRPNVQIAYFNESKLSQYGLKPPRSWEELLAVARTLKEREGIGRVALQAAPGGPVGVQVSEFIWQGGGDVLTLNDTGTVQAFDFLQTLGPHLAPSSATAKFDTMNTYLAEASVYLGQNWPFGINIIVRDAGKKEIKAYSGWAGPAGEFHVLGGEVLGIPRGAPNRELALKLAEYLMSQKVQETLVARMGWPSMRSDAYGQVPDWQKPYFESVKSALQRVRPRPNVVYWGEVERLLGAAYRDIVQERGPVKATLDRYAADLRRAQQASETR